MQRIRITIEIDTEISRYLINVFAKHLSNILKDSKQGEVVYLATEIVEETRNILEDKT